MASVDGKDADLPGGGRTLADRVRTPFSVREIVLRSIALPHKEVTMATRRFKSAAMKFGVPLSVPGSRYVMLDAKA